MIIARNRIVTHRPKILLNRTEMNTGIRRLRTA